MHEVPKAFVFLPQQVALWNPNAFKEQLCSVGGLLAHFVKFAASAKTCAVSLHQNERHALGPQLWPGLGHDHHQVTVQTIGDEGLGAVKDILVTFKAGTGADGLEVTARAGLTHGNRQNEFAARAARQPPRLLLGGAESLKVRRDDIGMQAKAQPANA